MRVSPAQRIVRYERACTCNSSSSGPRITMIQKVGEDANLDRATFTVRLVALACDVCDTPWVKVKDELR